tara:strand:- start:162 stop:596 length:435 start_codon:yes stop_codon:yes gene_type:complete
MPFKKKATRGFPHEGFDQADRKVSPNKQPAYGEKKDVSKYKQSTHPFLSVVQARELRKAQKDQNIREVTWILLNAMLKQVARGVPPALGPHFIKNATVQLIKLDNMEAAYERKLQKKIDALAKSPEDDEELSSWLEEDDEDYDD